MTQPYQWRADPPDGTLGSEPDVPTRNVTPPPITGPGPAAMLPRVPLQMPTPIPPQSTPVSATMPSPAPTLPSPTPVVTPPPALPPQRQHSNEMKVEAQAALGAYNELGPDYQDAVIESFLARLDQMNAARPRPPMMPVPMAQPPVPAKKGSGSQTAVIIVCIALAIPLTAIAGGMFGFVGLPLTWIGIIIVAFILGRGLGKN